MTGQPAPFDMRAARNLASAYSHPGHSADPLLARFSAVTPMCPTPKGSVNVATIMSTSLVSPMRAPVRIAVDR